MKTYYVYILRNRTVVLYIGVTNDLQRRLYEHKNRMIPGFTHRYNIDRLIYFETFDDVNIAIHREKQLKGWTREKKLRLIQSSNPNLEEISFD
jgi:putative endonuclease